MQIKREKRLRDAHASYECYDMQLTATDWQQPSFSQFDSASSSVRLLELFCDINSNVCPRRHSLALGGLSERTSAYPRIVLCGPRFKLSLILHHSSSVLSSTRHMQTQCMTSARRRGHATSSSPHELPMHFKRRGKVKSQNRSHASLAQAA